MLLELMLYLGPLAIIICVVMAIRGTRINRQDKEIPIDLMGLANSMKNMTNSERKWGLK
jgi:hypothetical protein